MKPVERVSPLGKYTVLRTDISQALGAEKDLPPEKGGHPFAVEKAVIPPGKLNFPLHAHESQWEFYMIESGIGEMVTSDRSYAIGPGDCFMCNPGLAHAIRNSGNEDLVYLVLANNPMADIVHYPDSGKWMAKPGNHCFRPSGDYYDGEE